MWAEDATALIGKKFYFVVKERQARLPDLMFIGPYRAIRSEWSVRTPSFWTLSLPAREGSCKRGHKKV
jgi:hypothetical protein